MTYIVGDICNSLSTNHSIQQSLALSLVIEAFFSALLASFIDMRIDSNHLKLSVAIVTLLLDLFTLIKIIFQFLLKYIS